MAAEGDEKKNPRAQPGIIPQRTRDGAEVAVPRVAGLGFGNTEEDGLVRGAGFVMIWMFLVSRGYSAADCL